jgi:hypothetical protein
MKPRSWVFEGKLPDLKHVILLRERDGSTSLTDRASTQFTPSGVEGLSDRNKVDATRYSRL